MKATIGAIFEVLQISERHRCEAADRSGPSLFPRGDDGRERIGYGQALVATVALQDILAHCELEVEVPDTAVSLVIPLLTHELTAPTG